MPDPEAFENNNCQEGCQKNAISSEFGFTVITHINSLQTRGKIQRKKLEPLTSHFSKKLSNFPLSAETTNKKNIPFDICTIHYQNLCSN